MSNIELTPIEGRLPVDEMGEPIVKVTTCGACGRSWNDAIISSVTPTPAGRCPFEYLHGATEGEVKPKVTMVCVRHPDYDNEYATFGGTVEIIDIDMGRMDLRDASECLDWAESHLRDVEDATDEVREYVAGIVLDVFNELDYDDFVELRKLPVEDLDALPDALRDAILAAVEED